MLHAGLALEMAKALERERRREYAKQTRRRALRRRSVLPRFDLRWERPAGDGGKRPARPLAGEARPTGASTRSFEPLLSAAGALSLLAIVLLGPIGIAAPVAIMAAFIVTLGPSPSRRSRRPGEERTVAGPRAPEATDRWSAWRVVEPDAAYLRRHAA